MPVQAKIVDIEYEPGGHQCVQSHSSKVWEQRAVIQSCVGASSIEDRGTGWMDVRYPSHLILIVSVDGTEHDIWIERPFRKAIGILTVKRRDVIWRTMPAMVEVVEKIGQKGAKYFALADHEFEPWIARVREVLAAKPKRVRAKSQRILCKRISLEGWRLAREDPVLTRDP